MAATGSIAVNSNQSMSSIDVSLPSGGRRQSLLSAGTNQFHHSNSSPSNVSLNSGHQITTLPEMVTLSPLIGNYLIGQPSILGSASQSELHVKEADPIPVKAGEIGYAVLAETILPPDSIVRNHQSNLNTLDDNLQTSLHPLRSVRTASSWSPGPSGSSPYADYGRGSPSKPRERVSGSKMLRRPLLLVFLGLVVFIATFVGFIQVQERINHNQKNPSSSLSNNMEIMPDLENHNSTHSANSSTTSSGSNPSNNNSSFVYLGTMFIVALLIEFWVFLGTLRRLYHRLGLWIDQEYPLLLPDLSDPEASIPQTPVLPLWARILRIQPQAVRPPLLPPYMTVLNMIRTGGRSETNLEGTGDVEDGEVIRTLAIGQGQAAPAFNGEEFKKSTIILSGPAKRNSISSVSPSVRSTSGLIQKLSRSLTGKLGSSNSSVTLENGSTSSPQIR